MKITIDQVMSWNPCYSREHILSLADGRTELTPLDIVGLENVTVNNKLWLLLRPDIISKGQLHWLATDFAAHVLPHWQQKYPDDNRPARAIQAKRDWLEGKINDNQMTAAEEAVWAAAWAARLAARSARSAWAAAWAARSAAEAARSAWAAAWAARSAAEAAWAKEAQWQLNRVVELLEILNNERGEG